MDRVRPPSELAVPPSKSAVGPVSGSAVVFTSDPDSVYWSMNRLLPELVRVSVPLPARNTARCPGVKDWEYPADANRKENVTVRAARRPLLEQIISVTVKNVRNAATGSIGYWPESYLRPETEQKMQNRWLSRATFAKLL